MKSSLVAETLESHNLRCTKQRATIYSTLLFCKDHPNAEDLHSRVKKELPTVSLATVYNTLETLVSKGVINKVQSQQGCVHYCPSAKTHAHFQCKKSGAIHDIDIPESLLTQIRAFVPEGFDVENIDISLSGVKKF